MFEQLKKPIIFCVVSGVLMTLIIFLNVAINKYNSSLLEISRKLARVKSNLSSMESTTREIDALLFRINNYLPSDFYESSKEGRIFSAFDDLKSRMKLAEVSISNIVDKADAVSLPVKITGPLNSYSDFVNNTGYLASLKFPFFGMKSISLVRKEDKDGISVTYLIDGDLQMPKKRGVQGSVTSS